MNTYEKAVTSLNCELIIDDTVNLPPNIRGYYTNEFGNIILLNKGIPTQVEKLCVLMEELGHYYTTYGDILDQSKLENRKQEVKARRWAVNKLIRVEQFIDAFKAGVRNRAELSEFLEVTEEFIEMAVEHFKGIYGYSYAIDEYTIFFNPLWVYKKI